MKNYFFFPMVSLLFMNTLAHAEMRNYSLCPNVQTMYFSDPTVSRGIVMNYDPVRKYFVFLRCGESDTQRATARTQQLKCHVYRQGHESALCRDEITQSRVSRVISDVVDAGVSSLISGGLSNLSKVRRIINTARELSITPQCLGTSMMKAMALGVNSGAITETFYQAATEIGPLTGITRFATRNPAAKANYIFSQLDAILSPTSRTVPDSRERRVDLAGPSYMTAVRNITDTDKLVLDTAEHQSLCSYMKNLGNEPVAPAEDEQARAISSQKNGLIPLD